MNKMKKLCLLLLCMGIVGGTAACDMSALTSMLGGESVDSQVESTGSEETSSEIPDGDSAQDQWNEAIKEDKFNNVTFGYSVVFAGETNVNTGLAYLDGDRAAMSADGGKPEKMTAEETEALRNIYVKTVLAVLDNFTIFQYDVVTNTFVSTAEVVYNVNVMGIEAEITASNVRVWFDADNNISAVSCDMVQEFVEHGKEKTLELRAEFTFTDYGKTVVPTPDEGDEPGQGETPGGDEPGQGETPEDGGNPENDFEAAWNHAFENTCTYDNYTMSVESTIKFFEDREDSVSNYTYYMNSNAFYNTGDGNYYVKEGDQYYIYKKESGEWVKQEYSTVVPLGSGMIQSVLTAFDKIKESFTYDVVTESYYGENIVTEQNGYPMTIYEARVYIVGDIVTKVVSESDVVTGGGVVIGRSHSTFTFADFNKTIVNLPTIDDGMSAEEKAWREAFKNSYEADNYSLSVAAESRYTTGKDPVKQSYTENFDGDVLVLIQENSTEYYVKEGDTVYRYRENGGIWTKSAYDGQVQFRGEAIKASFGPFEDMYKSFTYDEAEGCYVARNITIKNQYGNDETYYVAKISIENGYLTDIYVEGIIKNGDGEAVGEASISFTFFDRHTTLTRVPVIDAKMQVTEAEWIAAMVLAVKTDNITASMSYIYDYDDDANDSVSESYMRLGGNATFQWGDDYQQAYANENGVNYAYRFDNGVWTKSDMEMEVTYTNYRMASVIDPIRSLYSYFTYDVEKGVYTCAEAMADAGNGTMMPLYNLEVGFENGQVTYIYFEMDLTKNGENVGVAYVNIELWNYGTTVVGLPKVA